MKWTVSSPNVTWKIVTVLSGRNEAQYYAIASTMPWSAASLAMSLFPADDAMPDDDLWLAIMADTPRSAARLALPMLLPENFRGHVAGGGDAILLGDQCNDERDMIACASAAASHLSIDSRVAAAPTPLDQLAAPLTEAARCGSDGRSASLVMKGQAGEGTITECPSGTAATHTTASSAAADVHFSASGRFAAVVQPTAAVMGGNKQHFAPPAADTGKLLAAPMAADPAASALLFSVSADMRAAESTLVAGMLASAQPPILEAAAVAAAVSAAGADGLVLSGGPIDMALRNALEAAGISCAHRIRILSAMVSVRASERR